MIRWSQNCILVLSFFSFGIHMFTSTIIASSVVDSSLAAIATAAQTVGALNNDRGSYMTNYIKYHVAPAATRLSQVCNMTINSFTGNQSDKGVILGVSNNTNTTFVIQQGGQNIGQLTSGWNGDVVLNLSSLSSSGSTTVSLPSCTFIPATGSATSKLVVRVMTGQQLFTHITNEQEKESTTAASVTFLKNGVNDLPGEGENVATASDLYLVVENESLTSGAPLSAAAKRIQVLNLSNLTNIYTVSLSISSMGLASINNQVSQQNSLSSMFAVAIQAVHVLDEVNGHTVPLLLLPRAVYQAESSVNSLYAAYIQKYANALGGKYAGVGPVYYDLSIAYTHEPFEYLRLLKYFDIYRSLLAVVDQNSVMSSGQVIGSYIVTDVYGAYVQDVSPDLSWATCNDSGFDIVNNDQILFACAMDQDIKPGGAPIKVIASWLEQSLRELHPYQEPFVPSPYTRQEFPISQASSAMMLALTINPGQYEGCINVRPNNEQTKVEGAVLNTGNPMLFLSGQSYNYVGSMPSGWWTLGEQDSINGIKLVPVFYKATTCVPFLSGQDYQLVNSTNQSALYIYAYNSTTGQSLGIAPGLSMSGNGVALFNAPTVNTWWGTCKYNKPYACYQSAQYDSFVTAKPGDGNLTYELWTYLDYPGFGYFACLANNTNDFYMVRNKFANMLPLRDLIQNHWAVRNAMTGVCTLSIPLNDIEISKQNKNNEILIQMTKVSSNSYEMVLFDAQKNVVGFQLINIPENATQLMACRVSSQGSLISQSRSVKLPQNSGLFKLSHVPGLGLQLTPVNVSMATQTKPLVAAKQVPAPTTALAVSMPDNNVPTQNLIAENAKLRAENKKLRNELAAVYKKNK